MPALLGNLILDQSLGKATHHAYQIDSKLSGYLHREMASSKEMRPCWYKFFSDLSMVTMPIS